MIGTNLNVADDTDVEVFVGPYSMEMRCGDVEIEMYADSLALFIAVPRKCFPNSRPAPDTSRRPRSIATRQLGMTYPLAGSI